MKSNAPRGLNRLKIRKMYNDGYCPAAIARKYDCHVNAIMHHISDLVIPISGRRNHKAKLDARTVKAIRKEFLDKGKHSLELSKKYGVSESTILNVIHGIYYRYVPGEVIDKNGIRYTIPENNISGTPLNTKGRKKTGIKPGNNRRNHGSLLPLAKKHGVHTSTICKWLKEGKIPEPEEKTFDSVDTAKLISECSYIDKSFLSARQNIAKWKKRLRKLNIPNDNKNLLLYVLNSRLQNMNILNKSFKASRANHTISI